MSEYETRFGYIYANFTPGYGDRWNHAKVGVFIDDATRRPHSFGAFEVAIPGDGSPEGIHTALTAATDHMAKAFGVVGMTWVPLYHGFRGCQWHPETNRPVNGRAPQGSYHIPVVRPEHGER